jgi:cell division protein FtsL
MVCAVLLSAVFVIPVLVNSSTTDLEAATGRLQTTQQQLAQAGTDLSAQVSSLSSPARIAEEASKLGMRPVALNSIRYVQLGAGTVVAEGETTVASR